MRKILTAFVFVFLLGSLLNLAAAEANAQRRNYTGDPVTRYGLVSVLKGKQYQTRQIIAVIESQGVDFRLSDEIRKELVSAGARPALLIAVQNNFRAAGKSGMSSKNTGKAGGRYENLIAEAMEKFNTEQDTAGSVELLESAVKLRPRDSRAYQLLGFAHLYGEKDYEKAEEYMRQAIDLGGSAVFRVSHSHDVTYSYGCEGSLYVSAGDVRYESDNIEHTFDVPKNDITRVKTLGGWGSLIRRKGGAFKISIRDREDAEDEKDIFNFTPLTGKKDEARLIIELIGK